MEQWEYKFVGVPDEEVHVGDTDSQLERLNNAGRVGWEFTGHTEDTGFGINYLMKRKGVRV